MPFGGEPHQPGFRSVTVDGSPWTPALLVLVALLAIACVAAGAWGALWLRRWWRRRALLRRMRRARHGEERAGDWLEAHGFTVLDRQVTRSGMLMVDGEPAPFLVRADYLVERDGVRAVVEVKTGAVANAAARDTRRQILEYAWVYGVDEVHLFDADAQRLQRIAVGAPEAPVRAGRWAAARRTLIAFFGGVAVGVAAGLGAAWVLAR